MYHTSTKLLIHSIPSLACLACQFLITMESSRLHAPVSDFDFEELWEDGFLEYPGFHPKTGNGSPSVSSNLVFFSERGELVEAAALSVERKGMSAERSIAALRNHSEAERKRRARINSHLDTLRKLVPATNKMDKASLLAEVVTHLRGLKRRAAEASSGLLIPIDIDEVRVERQAEGLDGAPFLIKASLCCDSKPGLLSDLRQVLDDLPLIVVRAEIATLGGRMKNAFIITSCKEGPHGENAETQQFLANSVQQALRSILEKFSPPQEFSSRSALSSKRQRISLFGPSMSSSSEDLC